jgi:putative Holliday junction resolvase
MRVAAVDFGKVRVGLAVSDELGLLAHPRPFLDGTHLGHVFQALIDLSQQENVDLFLVGLPRLLDGSEGPAARRARRFAAKLKERTGRRVVMIDEWLSTREAQGRLRAAGADSRQARQRVDSAAAALLLQSWLDRRATPGSDRRHE